jgi:hypothetical protein
MRGKVGWRQIGVEARSAFEVTGVQEDIVGGKLELFIAGRVEEAHTATVPSASTRTLASFQGADAFTSLQLA